MDEQIYKYLQGELNPEEHLAFLKRVKSDDMLKKQFVEAKNLYALALLSEQAIDDEESRISYSRFRRKRQILGFSRAALKYVGYAAAVVFIVITTYLVTVRQVEPVIENEMFSLHVPAGQRLKFTLPDGTGVWLNARTTISYPAMFRGNERKVMIEGEALFDVAEDKEKPFIVSARGITMTVLGTEFNVYSYPQSDYVRVSLLEGSLSVCREAKQSDEVILLPNQEVTIDADRMSVETIRDPGYFLWTEGVYSFQNESLNHILRKLEMYYDIDIVVKDPTIYSWEYTGKFRQSHGIDEILRIIQKIHKFTILKDEENNTIILNK